MKKLGAIIGLFFLLAGCASQEASVTAAQELEAPKEHSMHEQALGKKEIKPEYFVYSLKDSRTGQVLKEYKPIHFSNKEVYEKEIKQLAREMAEKIDKPMKNAKIDANGNLINGTKKIVLSEKELVENLKNLKPTQLDVNVPIYETMPNVTPESVRGINEVVIGSYKTGFRKTDTGRNRNIELSARAINNVVIGPGDSFSYNETVGQRTAERGYQPAHEIINKELVMGIGGGICQTSSTLFNAVDQTGATITAITHHSKTVGYVPVGRDATVSWGGPDFKFVNNKDYPIVIKTFVDKKQGHITVEIRTAKRYV
ncbi:VanW family protein [Bacillus songklensis]|uniref:VanW family protein n=1 Tax=Bacillus songklensis TaxID=1069116 RepID=A0ABV8B9L6_9BACI